MANTAKQMIIAVGSTVLVRFEELYVTCIVLDVKNSWGKERLYIRPVTGNGQQWVEMSRLIPLADDMPVNSCEALTARWGSRPPACIG